jgi:hypothetical protein
MLKLLLGNATTVTKKVYEMAKFTCKEFPMACTLISFEMVGRWVEDAQQYSADTDVDYLTNILKVALANNSKNVDDVVRYTLANQDRKGIGWTDTGGVYDFMLLPKANAEERRLINTYNASRATFFGLQKLGQEVAQRRQARRQVAADQSTATPPLMIVPQASTPAPPVHSGCGVSVSVERAYITIANGLGNPVPTDLRADHVREFVESVRLLQNTPDSELDKVVSHFANRRFAG